MAYGSFICHFKLVMVTVRDGSFICHFKLVMVTVTVRDGIREFYMPFQIGNGHSQGWHTGVSYAN
jgi:hypothetical protein